MAGDAWRDVVVSRVVAVGGGYAAGMQTVASKQIYYEERLVDFINVCKNNHWLLKAAGGRTCQKGGLRRTQVLEDLREKLLEATPGDGRAKQSDGSAVADEADPMQRLEDLGETTEGMAAKRRKKGKARCCEQVSCIEMPANLGKPQLRPVRAMLGARNGSVLWMHEDDVPWLVRYLADEQAIGGVGPIEDSDGESDDECAEASEELCLDGAAVAAPSGGDPVTPTKTKKGAPKISWDFNGGWEAVIKESPQKSTTVSCKVANMSPEKWAAVAKVHGHMGDYERASFQEKKTAARHFLELHLQGCHAKGQA